MFKNIKSYINILLIGFVILSSNITYASDAQTETSKIEASEESVEENMKDLTKRLILATFGRDALTWFDVESDLDYSQEIDDGEMAIYTKPFNSQAFLLLQSFITTTIIIGFIVFSVYLYWIFKEGIVKTQTSGQFLGENWSTMFVMSKIAIVTVLLFPVFGIYNTSHFLLFKTLGYSNEVSKDITSTIISHQPKTYPTIKFPYSDVKKSDAENLISFASCIKSHKKSNQEVSFNFLEKAEGMFAVSNFENCSIEVKFGLDQKTNELIKNNDKLKNKLNLVVDYKDIQLKIMEKIFKEILEKSDKVSEVILDSPYDSSEKTNSAFDKYKLEFGTKIYIDNWESFCDDIYNFGKTTELTKTERAEYMYLSSRCISHDIVSYLIYPTEKNNFSNYLKTDNYLLNNQIEVCAHDYNNADGKNKTRKIIKESAKDTEEVMTLTSTVGKLSVEDCLIKTCASINSTTNPNLFMCSNVIHIYDEIQKNKKMEEAGFLTLGAYMYTMFNGTTINQNSKNLLNGFQIKFSNSAGSRTAKSDTTVLEMKHIFKKSNQSDPNIKLLKIVYEGSNIGSQKSKFQTKSNSSTGLANIANFNDNSAMNLFGAVKLSVCSENPHKIVNGYICGSITEELNNAGRSLSDFFIQTKIALHVFEAAFKTAGAINMTKKSATKGGVSGKSTEIKTISKKKLAVKALIVLAPLMDQLSNIFPGLKTMINNLMGDYAIFDKVKTDEFSNFNAEKQENHDQDFANGISGGIALIGALAGDNLFGEIINIVINIMILIGLIIGYGLPLIPLYLWFVIVVGWLLLIFETVAVLPVWIPSIATPNQSETSDLEKRGLLIILKLFLKAPLMCIGVLFAWAMTNSVVGKIVGLFSFNKIFSMDQGYSFVVILDYLIIFIIYLFFLFYIINIIISIIEGFYEFGTSWLDKQASGNSFGKNVGGAFLQGGQASKTIGMLNPLKMKKTKRN